MSRGFRQLALIGLLACMVSVIAPAVSPTPLRAQSQGHSQPQAPGAGESDRLTRTIQQLAERAAEREHQPQAPAPPERPTSRDTPAHPDEPTRPHEPADADQPLVSDPQRADAPAADAHPNELRRLGSSFDDDDGDEAHRFARQGDGSWVLQTVTALGIVIALLLLLRWGWMRLSGMQGIASTPVVEVLSRTPVAPRNHVLLLRVGPRILIVGDSSSGMRTLASVEDEQEVADLLAAINAAKPDSISQNFQQLLGRFGAAHDRSTGDGSDGLSDAEGWRVADEGRDHAEHLLDRTRNNVSGLASRIRSLSRKGGQP